MGAIEMLAYSGEEYSSSGGQCVLAGAQELKARDIEGLDAKIADLTATIDKLAKEIAALQAEVAEMQKQLKRAGEDREVSEDGTVQLLERHAAGQRDVPDFRPWLRSCAVQRRAVSFWVWWTSAM